MGTVIPVVASTVETVSNQVALLTAEITPIGIPMTMLKMKAMLPRYIVIGKAALI